MADRQRVGSSLEVIEATTLVFHATRRLARVY